MAEKCKCNRCGYEGDSRAECPQCEEGTMVSIPQKKKGKGDASSIKETTARGSNR